MVKNLPAMREDLGSIPGLGRSPAGGHGNLGSIPGLGRSPAGGHGNPLQCSCLWTEEPGRLQSMSCKESDTTE